MSRSRGNAAWARHLRRRQYAAHFVAFGSLYSTGHDVEEELLIRDDLAELGINTEGRLEERPTQLDDNELVFDSEKP